MDNPTCPNCGGEHFVAATVPPDVTLRCHPGCEIVWHPSDLTGERYTYLRDALLAAKASDPIERAGTEAPPVRTPILRLVKP